MLCRLRPLHHHRLHRLRRHHHLLCFSRLSSTSPSSRLRLIILLYSAPPHLASPTSSFFLSLSLAVSCCAGPARVRPITPRAVPGLGAVVPDLPGGACGLA